MPSSPKGKIYCRFLRGKNAYGTLEGGGRPFLDFDTGSSTYWCLRTMGSIGPDDRLAHLSTCGDPKRACHQPPRENPVEDA